MCRPRLVLSLVLILSTACGDSETPSPGSNEDFSRESEDDHKAVTDPKPAKDTGELDAGKSAQDAADASDDKRDPPPTVDTQWCKAKAILDEYCVSCHDGEGSGGSPMGLTSSADLQADAVQSKGKKVYEVVGERIHDSKNPMPPQKKLRADELATLDAFVAAAAPAGDPSCEGGSTQDAGAGSEEDLWKPEDCDAVYKIFAHGATQDEPYQVPPGQEIQPQVYWDAPWGDEKVQMVAARPIQGNKKVLHHWIMWSSQGTFLAAWAPGLDTYSALPPDVGMNMPTGTRSLRLDMHYFNTLGTETETDMSGLEMCILKGDHLRPKAAAVASTFASFDPVLAPAGANNRPSTGICNVQTTSPVTLMSVGPHAHTAAVHMKFTVTKKNGEEIVLHDAGFNFSEERLYDLDPPVVLETGDTVYTTCYYTNPTTRNITIGESSTNEMCFNFASYWPAGALRCSGLDGLLLEGLSGLAGIGALNSLGNLVVPGSRPAD